MVDWTDPATIENAAKATLSVSAIYQKLKRRLQKNRKLSDEDLLKMLALTAIALDASNENIKKLFKMNGILAEYVEAKQAEAESVLGMLKHHGDFLAETEERVERLERRVGKLDGRKPNSKRESGKKRKRRD
jgi:hypothetical protein